MRYLISFFLVALLPTIKIYAQKQEPLKDPKAKVILDKISKEAENSSSIQLKFDYKIINNQTKQTETQKGYAFLQKDKYKLIITGVEIISDGKSIYTYQKGINEMTINNVDPEEESIFNPTKLYSMYKKGFKYRYLSDYSRDGMQLSIIDLYPENIDEKNFTRIRIEVDTRQNRIASFTTFGKDGIDYVIIFNQYKKNIKLPEDFFIFKKEKYSKDIEIVDLR